MTAEQHAKSMKNVVVTSKCCVEIKMRGRLESHAPRHDDRRKVCFLGASHRGEAAVSWERSDAAKTRGVRRRWRLRFVRSSDAKKSYRQRSLPGAVLEAAN
eukprot:2302533-Pleurochrysis_carterae.AAC.1